MIAQHRQERDKRVCDRIKAVLAYADGHSCAEIARWLLLDDETICRHIDDCQLSKKLSPENGGSEPRLSDQQTEKLLSHLDDKTYVHVKDICAYVKQAFNQHYSISGMAKWLHSHDFCYKKPHPMPAKTDKALQLEFIKLYGILKASVAGKDQIYIE